MSPLKERMDRLKSVLVVSAFLALAGVPAFAQADVAAAKTAKTGLLGGTVQLEYIYMDDANSVESTVLRKATIDSQVEYDDSQLRFGAGKPWKFCVTLDVTDHKIRISDVYLLWNGNESHKGRINPTKFNGFVLTFKNIQAITGVTVNPETTLGDGQEPALDAQAIQFSKNQITINWSNVRIDEKTVISLDVETETPQSKN
jgi:hypothetical protein